MFLLQDLQYRKYRLVHIEHSKYLPNESVNKTDCAWCALFCCWWFSVNKNEYLNHTMELFHSF